MSMNSMPYIPMDLWGLIFVHGNLPFKFLGRLRLVCKCWYSFIGSQYFIDAYNETEAGKTDRVLVKSEMTNFEWRGVLVFCPGGARENDLELPVPVREGGYGFRIIGSCKGLVCIYLELVIGLRGMLVLWNPSIDRYKRVHIGLTQWELLLDEFWDELWEDEFWDEFWDADTIVGFGYKETDYKAVRITEPGSKNEYSYGAHVYSLRHDAWSRITTIPQLNGSFPVHFERPVGTYFNGTLYWLYRIGDLPERHMLSFDIGSETFTTEPLGESVPLRAGTIDVSVGVFKNALSLFHMREEGVFTHCEIWVKGENNDWEYKGHLMNPGSFEIAWPFAGTSDHRFHMLLNNEDWPSHQFVLYDIMSRIYDDLEIQINWFSDNYIGEYEESFTLLD